MALPPTSGHGPFGQKGFRGALIACVVLVVAGSALTVLAGDALASMGAVLLALGALGLTSAGVGMLAERHLQRRR